MAWEGAGAVAPGRLRCESPPILPHATEPVVRCHPCAILCRFGSDSVELLTASPTRYVTGIAASSALRAALLVALAALLLWLQLPALLHGRAPNAGAIALGLVLWLAGGVRA